MMKQTLAFLVILFFAALATSSAYKVPAAFPNTHWRFEEIDDKFIVTTPEGGTATVTLDVQLYISSGKGLVDKEPETVCRKSKKWKMSDKGDFPAFFDEAQISDRVGFKAKTSLTDDGGDVNIIIHAGRSTATQNITVGSSDQSHTHLLPNKAVKLSMGIDFDEAADAIADCPDPYVGIRFSAEIVANPMVALSDLMMGYTFGYEPVEEEDGRVIGVDVNMGQTQFAVIVPNFIRGVPNTDNADFINGPMNIDTASGRGDAEVFIFVPFHKEMFVYPHLLSDVDRDENSISAEGEAALIWTGIFLGILLLLALIIMSIVLIAKAVKKNRKKK